MRMTTTSTTSSTLDAQAPSVGMTVHANQRAGERDTPAWVLAALRDRPFIAQRREPDGRLSNLRIIKVRKGRYWVGVERDGVLITVMPVGFNGSARNWFRNRILIFEVIYKSIKRIPVTAEPLAPCQVGNAAPVPAFRTSKWRELNDELALLWGVAA